MSNEVVTSDLESAQSSEEPEVSTNDLPEEETEETEGAETEEESTEEPEEEAEGETEEEPEESGDDAAASKPKKKGTAQERIAELTRLRREAERERDAYRQMLSEMSQGKQQESPKPQESLKPPRRYDFSSDEEYDAALLNYTEQRAALSARQAVEQFQKQQQQTEAQRKQQETIQQATKAEAQFAKQAEDYFEVIETESPLNDDAVRQTLPAESVPKVLYYLHKHPEEAQRIADLPTTEQAVYEIGKLESSLSQKPRRKETTQAPEKPRKVGGRGKAVKGWHPGMSMSEVMKKQGYRK